MAARAAAGDRGGGGVKAGVTVGLWAAPLCAMPAAPPTVRRWDSVPPPVTPFLENRRWPVGDEWSVRSGGMMRSIYEGFDNFAFGLQPGPEEPYFIHRLEMDLAVERGEAIRLFSNLLWASEAGKDEPLAPVDEDEWDFLELYAQGRAALPGGSALTLRAGRQFLYYGSGRLFAQREGPNIRLTHDAVRLGWTSADEAWQVDAFAGSPVRIESGSFDNGADWNRTTFWAVYAIGPSPFGAEHGVDAYYIGLDEAASAIVGGGVSERRHTFGSRWWGREEAWSYNHEFIVQFGEAGGRDIRAGAASLGVERAFAGAWGSPSLGLKADFISGGGDGGEIRTFNPLFQANVYFNEGGFIAPSNLWNLNPYLVLRLSEAVSLTLGANFQWRVADDDAVYGPPFVPIAAPAPGADRYLGTAWNLAVGWAPHPSARVSLGFTHQDAGPSLEAVGGRDATYAKAELRFEF